MPMMPLKRYLDERYPGYRWLVEQDANQSTEDIMHFKVYAALYSPALNRPISCVEKVTISRIELMQAGFTYSVDETIARSLVYTADVCRRRIEEFEKAYIKSATDIDDMGYLLDPDLTGLEPRIGGKDEE
jgi:hypothetical protein